MQEIASGSFEQRFGGIARLYGAAPLQQLSRAHVGIIGIGGVGSWSAEALARSGIGSITLIDLDDICLTNINRQAHALEHTIGRSKIETMAQRCRDIHPHIHVHCHAAFFTESTADSILGMGFDAIIDAIDRVAQKALLIAAAKARNIPIVSVGGAGGRIDPSRIRCADLSQSEGDRLLMLTRKRLRSHHRFPRPGKGKFKVPCVFSDEPPRFPVADGTVTCQRPGSGTNGQADADSSPIPSGMNCDTGFGSAVHITAPMGFYAAGIVLNQLASATR